MTTFENLPKEMMINILSRLPPESVFQFILVSKFWYALIIDPTNASLLQYKHILFMRLQKDSDSGKTQLILSDLALDPSLSLLNHFHLPLPFDWNQSPFSFDDDLDFYEKFHIHNHSHGLVCLTDYYRNIVLCNPTTREFRKLPPSIIMLTYPLEYIYDGCGSAVGFGYDPKSRDFKVVRIVCYRTPAFCWRMEIFDLSKDRWREVEVLDIIDDVQEVPLFGIYHEGTLFWVIITRFNESYIRTIYSFDLREEVFGQIRLPGIVEETEIAFEIWNQMDMGVLNGFIVIFHETWKNNHLQSDLDIWELDLNMNIWELESTLDIWKMEKNDESSVVSWSKLFTIGISSEIGRPIMFLSSNKFLMIKEEQVGLYDVKTQQFKELPMKANAWDAYVDGYLIESILKEHGCEATNFVRSLFSVKGEKY